MIKKIIITLLIITPLLLFAFEVFYPKPKTAPPQEVVGTWKAEANTDAGPLQIYFKLYKDGTIEGSVGEATMVNAYFKENRGWLGKSLNMGTRDSIVGKLDGPVTDDLLYAQFQIVGRFNENGIRGDFACREYRKHGEKQKPPSASRLTFDRVESTANAPQ